MFLHLPVVKVSFTLPPNERENPSTFVTSDTSDTCSIDVFSLIF